MGIKNLNKVKMLRYADNAKMYQSFDFIEHAAKVKISLPIKKIEQSSFKLRFQIRNSFVMSFATLRRRALAFAKKIMSLKFKLMIFMNSYFQKNYKYSRENLYIQNQPYDRL